jgi:hypothetical protein
MRVLAPLLVCALAAQARPATVDAVEPAFGLVEKALQFGTKIVQWTLGAHVDVNEYPRPPHRRPHEPYQTNNTLYQQLAAEPECVSFFGL